MKFLAAERLLLLLPVLALAGLYIAMQARRKHYAVKFTNLDLLDSVAPKRPGWRRHLTAGLAALAAAAMVFGLARPTAEMTVREETAVVLLAIDTSVSMDATDVAPSRISAVKAEAISFVDDLPAEFEVGLVAFDETARVLAPPSLDHTQVTLAISRLVTAPGTAGGDAIEVSLNSIALALADDSQPIAAAAPGTTTPPSYAPTVNGAPTATIVMLSDGKTTVGLPIDEGAQLAAEAGVPVSTITYGTSAGTITYDNQTIAVPPDVDTMFAVSLATGGSSFTAATGEQLRAVYKDIEANIGTTTEQRELSLAFVGAGLAALLLAAGASFVWTGRFL